MATNAQSQMTNIFGKQILYPVGDPRTKQKGMGYGQLIVDNIIGLDNEYESFGDVLRSEFKKDKLGFLSNIAKGAFEGTRSFLQKPADQQMNVVKDIAKEIKDSVVRLSTQDLDKRLQNMFGVSYQEATETQVNKARESVIGDSITALELTGLTGPAVRGSRAILSGISETIPGSVKAETIGKTKSLFQGDLESFFEKEYKGTPTPAGAQVSGMFERKKTPVEEYLTPVEVNYGKEVVELIGSISKDLKGPGGLIRGQEIKLLKFDELSTTDSMLVNKKDYGNNKFKIPIGTNVYSGLGSLLEKGRFKNTLPEYQTKRNEPDFPTNHSPKDRDNFVKQTTNMATAQIQEQFNNFLSDNPALVLKLAASKELKEKYKQYIKDDDSDINLPTFADEAKYDAALELEEETIREILDKFFVEGGIAYAPDPGQFFKEKKFTFETTYVDQTGAQVVEEITEPSFTGLFKDLGWDHGVYDFETVFGSDSIKKYFSLPLRRVLKKEFGSTAGIIDSDTRIVKPSPGMYKTLPGNHEWPELSFQDIVDSYDKNLLRSESTSSGQFINLGEEILNDFVNKELYTDGNLNEEKLYKTVLGADILKLLENDPRMNIKNIPESMKTQEFKNQKFSLQNVAEEIRQDFVDESFSVTAKPLDKPKWADMQLQRDAGFEGGRIDYTYEVPILGRTGFGSAKSFSPKKNHYGIDTLSHVRFTVYNPNQGLGRYSETDTFFDELIKDKDFILVEELQSDLISGGVQKFKKIPYKVENTRKIIDKNIKEFDEETVFKDEGVELIKEYADDIAKDITEFFDELDNKPPTEVNYKGLKLEGPDYALGTSDLAEDAYNNLKDKYRKLIQKEMLDGKIDSQQEIYANNLLNIILAKVRNPGQFVRDYQPFYKGDLLSQRVTNMRAKENPSQYGSPPIKRNIEAVELNIQTLINQANNMGIDRIVIPNFDMIAARRFSGDELKAAVDNKSIKKDNNRRPIYDDDGKPVLIEGNALYRNYVTDLEKVLDKFKKEYPEIKIEYGVELPYRPSESYFSSSMSSRQSKYDNLRTDGIVIDISEMKKLYDLEKPKFAKGGVTMKDQMEMAFMQEGGLKDDGMDIDPVSGNEVPPGSMAKEVRDDIPAQLSEGEYVVPADVVQYYGVKFFEDLRMDAKRGLADMEANGRIGGEPVDMPMDMPMDDTPTVAVSTGGYIDGMPAAEYNVGGMASNIYNDPTQMDEKVNNIISTMYNEPQVMDELARRGIQVNRTQAQMMPQQMNQANPPSQARMGFQEGGLNYNPAFNPMYQTPGASYIYAAPPPLTTGVDSSVPSVENCNKMGMDYDPVANICVPREVAKTPQRKDDDDGGPDLPKPDPDAWMEKYDYTGDLSTLAKQTGDAIAGGSNLPGPLGTFDKGVTLAHSAGHIILLQAQGKTEEAERLKQEWDKARTGALKLTPLEMIDGDRFAIQAAGAHGIKLDRDMISPIDGKALFRNDRDYERYLANYKISAKDKKVTPTAGPLKTSKDITSAADIKQKQEKRSEEKSAASKAAEIAGQAEIDKAKEDRPTGAIATSEKIQDTIKKSKEELESQYGSGLQKGGLMSKKKKKKK